LDYLSQLLDDLTRIPPVVTGWQPPAVFEAGARALGDWLDATKDAEMAAAPGTFKALEAASKQLNEERRVAREKILEDIALQRTPMTTARAALDTLVWAGLALYHSWRPAESLRVAFGK
jgi:phosphate:Na+ symporter